MSTSTRMILVKAHMLLAAFIFPAVVMFLVTGGFYTWGVKGSYSDHIHLIKLDQPVSADLAQLTQLIEGELASLGVSTPSGKAKVKKAGTSFKVEWTGSKRDVVFEPTTDQLVARLSVRETTWYRNLVQLHKAKGGQPFKIYAAVLAISLFTILSTGFLIAFGIPKYRKLVISAAMAGVLLFIVMVSMS